MSLSSAPPTLAPRASRAGRGLERGPAVGAPDEAGLVAALRSGDEAAFNEFLTHHHASMVRLAQSYVSSHAVAEEVVQETLEVVLTRLERFERRSTLKTWMFRILVNRAKTRGQRERRTVPSSSLGEVERSTPTVDPALFQGVDGPDPGARCDRFDGFPGLTDGKADAHVLCVRPAIKNDNVTLKTHSRVVRLETDRSGLQVSHVVVDRAGSEESYSGDVVVVSCGAAHSPALLLRSANDHHPNGLANSSDIVGRNYMAHINSGVIALSQAPNETKFQKTLGVNDYYWGASDSELPLGHIQMLGKSDRNILRAGAPWFAPALALDYMSKHAIDFWLTTEDLPRPDNRITLDRRGNIHLSKTFHNEEPHRRLLGKLKSLFGELGCSAMIPRWSVLDQRIPLAGIAHQCGTVRFGTDPKQSALDVNCKAHDLDNLYVVDTSFFPGSSAVNPALTAMANALRVGDHLLERLDARVKAPEKVKAGEAQELTT